MVFGHIACLFGSSIIVGEERLLLLRPVHQLHLQYVALVPTRDGFDRLVKEIHSLDLALLWVVRVEQGTD